MHPALISSSILYSNRTHLECFVGFSACCSCMMQTVHCWWGWCIELPPWPLLLSPERNSCLCTRQMTAHTFMMMAPFHIPSQGEGGGSLPLIYPIRLCAISLDVCLGSLRAPVCSHDGWSCFSLPPSLFLWTPPLGPHLLHLHHFLKIPFILTLASAITAWAQPTSNDNDASLQCLVCILIYYVWITRWNVCLLKEQASQYMCQPCWSIPTLHRHPSLPPWHPDQVPSSAWLPPDISLRFPTEDLSPACLMSCLALPSLLRAPNVLLSHSLPLWDGNTFWVAQLRGSLESNGSHWSWETYVARDWSGLGGNMEHVFRQVIISSWGSICARILSVHLKGW